MNTNNIHSKNRVATIWLSGITASGKTTLGKLLYEDLNNYGIVNIKFYDGEDLRESLDKNYGHTLDDRYKVLEQYINIIKKSNEEGNIIIVATVSHKKKMRDLARKRLDNFMEINLKCDSQVCSQRDYKGVYSNINIDGECLPGITEPYEFTNSAELVLDTEQNSIEDSRIILLNKTLEFLNGNILQDKRKH